MSRQTQQTPEGGDDPTVSNEDMNRMISEAHHYRRCFEKALRQEERRIRDIAWGRWLRNIPGIRGR